MTLPRLPEHVAEADGTERSTVRSTVEQEALAHPLRRTHHARGPDRLVGRYEDEALRSDLSRGIEHVPRAQHVCRDRLNDVGLEDRDVLVGGRVEHDIGLPARERVHHGLAIGDVGQDLLHLAVGRGGRRRLVQVRLVVVEHDQDVGSEARHLPADLRSDRSARPGDQDPPAVERVLDRSQIGDDLAPAEEVLDPRLTGRPDGDRRF